MIKAIFLDVDGTLISFKTHRVPASALDALREAHARGVQLFIATGRAAADLADLEAIPYDGVAALNGGDCLMRDGRVVAEFAAHFGFAIGETMAFGDGGNDVAMLRAAGAGVAMGNACDEALAAADYVTASVDDDGIRRALEHFGVI